MCHMLAFEGREIASATQNVKVVFIGLAFAACIETIPAYNIGGEKRLGIVQHTQINLRNTK